MANCGKDILLQREGTEQKQRFLEKLDPAWIKLNDFGLEEWMKFAWDFAAHLNYFDTGENNVNGNWQDFFIAKDELSSFLERVEQDGEITPHLALYITFIKLLETSKQHFNKLTQRHLDFYFKNILQLKKQAAQPDSVYVLFELAKNAVSEKIDQSSALDAGKDAGGKKLVYKTTEELIANQTRVAALKSQYNDHEYKKLKAAKISNSFDGKGAAFPDKEAKWWPFGYYEKPPESEGNDLREYPELEDARIGFALSGEILELKEGERNVQITLDFENALTKKYTAEELYESLEFYFTGEKGWLGPFEVSAEYSGVGGSPTFVSGSNSGDSSKLHMLCVVPKDEKAIVAYDQKVHQQHFHTSLPVCRVLLKSGETIAHDLYRDLVDRPLTEVKIDVAVNGIESLNLYNDTGTLNATRPFYPFGTQPVKKSKFYVDYAELHKKKWSTLDIHVEWKNTPANFHDWYYAYRQNEFLQFSTINYISGIYEIQKNIPATAIGLRERKFRVVNEVSDSEVPDTFTEQIKELKFNTLKNFLVKGNDYFKAAIEINKREEWMVLSGLNAKPLFEGPVEDIFNLDLSVSNPDIGEENIGPVRLSLNQTFLHEMYPRLYALAMSSEDKSVIVPNEPYTPFIEKVTLDYHAFAQIKSSGDPDAIRDFDLFHEHPFGQAVEDVKIKIQNGILTEPHSKDLYAVPTYCNGGELYIGLENALPQQTVSLLIQVLEGSENPETDSFVGKQKVEWWMLCNNDWKQLERAAIISNQTDNLLKSGLFKFKVPKEATTENTLLPAGMMWLKARIHKKYNAVSKVIGIHAQAVEAKFENNNNELDHLNDGLPSETIAKMVVRPPRIKSLSQPYSSFGGKPTESDSAFYRRVSERLRHKNRAVTIWDYEHLVLERFPEIHKVKCLNHTSTKIKDNKRKTAYLAPGNVLLVVIPDIVNRNVFDIYKPRVSKARLNSIENFLKKLNSPLVTIKVINPEYEEVRVDLKVQFHSGFDEVHYKTVLKEDLTRLLSPWAFDNKAAIQFGLSLHKSIVIDYVEKLNYVDFVSDVKLFQKNAATGNEKKVNVAIPNSPEAILVSSKTHSVNDVENKCSNIKTEPAESCQS